MLSRPSTLMSGRNANVGNSASTGLVSANMAAMQQRPQNLRVKIKPSAETAVSQIISATHRTSSYGRV